MSPFFGSGGVIRIPVFLFFDFFSYGTQKNGRALHSFEYSFFVFWRCTLVGCWCLFLRQEEVVARPFIGEGGRNEGGGAFLGVGEWGGVVAIAGSRQKFHLGLGLVVAVCGLTYFFS